MIIDIDEIKALRAENERLRAEAKASPVPVLLAEIKRLRAIELAARAIFGAGNVDPATWMGDGCVIYDHLIPVRDWKQFLAALAAKEHE